MLCWVSLNFQSDRERVQWVHTNRNSSKTPMPLLIGFSSPTQRNNPKNLEELLGLSIADIILTIMRYADDTLLIADSETKETKTLTHGRNV